MSLCSGTSTCKTVLRLSISVLTHCRQATMYDYISAPPPDVQEVTWGEMIHSACVHVVGGLAMTRWYGHTLLCMADCYVRVKKRREKRRSDKSSRRKRQLVGRGQGRRRENIQEETSCFQVRPFLYTRGWTKRQKPSAIMLTCVQDCQVLCE